MFGGGLAGGALRCSPCDINYPRHREHDLCLICKKPTWLALDVKVDDDWRDQVKERTPAGNSILELVRMSPHKPDARVNVFTSLGRQWIKHDALLDVGYTCLETDSIVFVNDTFYELQGFDKKIKSWWVEEIKVDASELTPEKVIEGG